MAEGNNHTSRSTSRRTFIATSSLITAGLAGCIGFGNNNDGGSGSTGDGGSGITELTYWHQEGVPHRQKQFEKYTQKFNQQQDRVEVTVEPQNWNSVFGKLTSALEAGKEPDFMFSLPAFTMTFQSRGALVDVSDIVKDLKKNHGLFENSITPFQYQGGTWGIPMWDMVFLHHYRTDTLGETNVWKPKNWQQWSQAVTKVSGDNHYGITLPAAKNLWTTENLYTLMINNGAYVYGPQGKIMFDTPETVETLEFYKKVFKQASPPSATNWGWAEWERSLLQGTSYSTNGFSSWVRSLEETGLAGKFGAIEQPYPKNGQEGSVHYVNDIMVFNENKKSAIAEFVKFLHSEGVYGEWLANTEPTLYLPVTKTGKNSKKFWNHNLIKKHEKMVRTQFDALPKASLYGFRDIHVKNNTYIPSVGTLEGSHVLGEVAQQLIVNDRSPKDAASWGQNRLQNVLQVDKSNKLN